MVKQSQKFRRILKNGSTRLVVFLLFVALFAVSCSELDKPVVEPYYAESPPPPKQELRWSNGKMPKSFDPALAAAPPETDIVRAIYEGLTETDPKTLKPIPAAAEKWSADEENLVWTFHLRPNAKWSNGEAVSAADFVRSWKRLAEKGDELSHPNLIENISGVEFAKPDSEKESKNVDSIELIPKPQTPDSPIFKDQKPLSSQQTDSKSSAGDPKKTKEAATEKVVPAEIKKAAEFGATAVSDLILKVKLKRPDKDFPSLVSHPMFRPVHSGSKFEPGNLNADIVTNGAFRVASVGTDGVTVDKSDKYWNREHVKLERVKFVPKDTAEEALQAYRAGDLDAVTNAEFEPLALKLLKPYDDFQTTIHSALNFYQINESKKPFDDRRVREALTIGIERERLTDDEMDGSTKPAFGFQPPVDDGKDKIKQDVEKARKLLSESGFPAGENFPPIKLLINRNNVQQRIARSVAKMWKENLNIETEIVVMEAAQMDEAVAGGEFDMYRRGVVLPTSDETVNMLAIFSPPKETREVLPETAYKEQKANSNSERPATAESKSVAENQANIPKQQRLHTEKGDAPVEHEGLILTEDEALERLLAIPLYFPTSYSLVKPYVLGFEINSLDAPSLLEVSIDNYWQPSRGKNES